MPETSVEDDRTNFLRIYIKGYTAVVKKRATTLREALQNKLKCNNLNTDNCVPFVKETRLKIDWNTQVNRISADSISVIQVEDDVRHSFTKFLIFQIINNSKRNCDSCHKRLHIYFNVCKNCNYSICSKDECRAISEVILCIRDKTMISSPSSIFSKMRKKEAIFYLNSNQNNNNNISEQILPVTEIKPCLSYRMRSSSDSELKSSALDASKEDLNKIQDGENEPTNIIKRNKKPRCIHRTRSSRWDSLISCEIPYNTVTVSSKIGTGSYGYVHKGTVPTEYNLGIVAIKFLSVKNPTPYQVQLFRNEIAILKSTRHDNVLSFVGCILKPHLAIVTEWCPGSSLYRHIHVDEANWEMNQLVDIAKQTAAGMEYLHNKSILHRDLKSNNIFLKEIDSNDLPIFSYSTGLNSETKNFKVKIGDFGLAMMSTINKYDLLNKQNSLSGSILWMAPEVITQKIEDPYSTKSDVYSFAVVLYEMMTGNLPYMKREQNMILFLVGSGKLKLNVDDINRDDVPPEIKYLISICSKYERNERLDFIEITQKLNEIKIDEKPRVIRRHSLPDINSHNKSSLICSKFVLQDGGERFSDIKIDLVEDYLKNKNHHHQIDQDIARIEEENDEQITRQL